MRSMLYVGGPMHGKRWTGQQVPRHIPVAVVDGMPCCPMHAKMGMRFDEYGVLPMGRFHTEFYETRIAIIRGRKVFYLSYKGAA